MGNQVTPENADRIRRLTPGVHRWVHALLSGLMWSAVGIMLCSMAVGWLSIPPIDTAFMLAAAGLTLALAIYRFGFSRIAAKNLRRISAMKGKVCIFAFQEWKSYLIVVFMITLGRTLRLSPFPKPALAALYIGIGGGLFFSSLASYKWAVEELRNRKESNESNESNQPYPSKPAERLSAHSSKK